MLLPNAAFAICYTKSADRIQSPIGQFRQQPAQLQERLQQLERFDPCNYMKRAMGLADFLNHIDQIAKRTKIVREERLGISDCVDDAQLDTSG
jgi:hypothetical protein